MPKVPLMNLARLHQRLRPELDRAIAEVIDSGRFINGPQVKDFEDSFAASSELKQVIGCANGTDAIMVLLKALGLGPGDEVIVPTMTFIATSEAITAIGAKVVFVDIRFGDYCIDPEQVRKAITPKTKAVIAVHLHGNVAPVQELADICRKHQLYLIEDSAQAHLAKLNGQPVGSFGVAATFSFFPGKNLGALGDAGAIGTNDQVLADKLRKLVNHGRLDKYRHDLEGYNMRLDTLQAAVLKTKLTYLKSWTSARREKAAKYFELLAGLNLVLPFQSAELYNVYHLFVLRVKSRDKVAEAFKKAGIETGVHYPLPLHLQPAYAHLGYREGTLPVAEQCSREFLSIPICSEITTEEQQVIAEVLKNCLRN